MLASLTPKQPKKNKKSKKYITVDRFNSEIIANNT